MKSHPFLIVSTALTLLAAAPAQAGVTYESWAAQRGLQGAEADPKANPDGDKYNNVLEYTFGTDPLVSDSPSEVAPTLEVDDDSASFVYRVSPETEGQATFRVLQSKDMKTWTPVPGEPEIEPGDGSYSLHHHPIPMTTDTFYVLEVSMASATGPIVVTVGTNVGAGWTGIPPVQGPLPSPAPNPTPTPGTVVIRTEQPNTGVGGVANTSKYPTAAGASLGSVTQQLKADYEATPGKRLPLRSWMGWFLWGNGTPPPGVNPGSFATPAEYGQYDGSGWDYFNYQWQKNDAAPDGGRSAGSWQAIRLDQQPLYLTPLTLNYNWAPGLFGYESQPLKRFALNTFYWQDKKIVRGVNLSSTIPFFYQYGDKLTSSAVPPSWHTAWLYLASRPMETTVVVPSNLTPVELQTSGTWNKTATGNDPFPYPVWDKTTPAANQTPFAILTDKIGDWHADVVYEAANPRSGAYYTAKQYKRSAFNQPGIGNYMKMTVAQGSPFVWFETNNNRYVNFYNLIRTNLKDQIANNKGTNAGVVQEQSTPYEVSGVQGVKFVLLYGDHVNPNQWYQESMPWYAQIGGGAEESQLPGGFNPPPGPYRTKSGTTITAKGQHNHTYTAIFFRDDAVKPFQTGKFSQNIGTDKDGNPYLYFEFKNPGKNWFVIGSVPEMRYYHSGVSQDTEAARLAAAVAWAQEMGQYAFNFVTSTKIDYAVTNMYQVTTNHSLTVQNPYVAAGAKNAAAMTVPGQTIVALNPHQYQPITLGQDLTSKAKPTVTWNPLQKGTYTDFPSSKVVGPPNANKSNPAAPSRWGYWSLRGNLKAIVTKGFSTVYPFQNFLPVMPPPKWDKSFTQTGIQAVNITTAGTGYNKITSEPVVEIIDHSGKGTGATAKALVNEFTGEIQQIDVVSKGSEFPDGMPNANVEVKISGPPVVTKGSVTAQAYAQTGGGQVLAIFMLNKGAGYASTIKVSQTNSVIDAPIIVPKFDDAGHMLPGLAEVVEGGAGFDFSRPITLEIIGTGTGALAQVVQPGNILDFQPAGGGVGAQGIYPSLGTSPAAQITVAVPPPNATNAAQTAAVTMQPVATGFIAAMINRGSGYTSKPEAYFVSGTGNVPLALDFGGEGNSQVMNVYKNDTAHYPQLTAPVDVVFTGGGTPAIAAKARLYPTYTVSSVFLTGPLARPYTADAQTSFLGGDIYPAEIGQPNITFTVPLNGNIDEKNIEIVSGGTGFTYPVEILIKGGQGFDAVLEPTINQAGELLSVRVLRGGSGYLPEGKVFAFIDNPQHTGADFAELEVKVVNGTVTAVNVKKRGKGYTTSLVVKLTAKPPTEAGVPDFAFQDNPKGVPARFTVTPKDGALATVVKFGLPPGRQFAKYLQGTENKATLASVPASIIWFSNTPFARMDPAGGFIARAVLPETNSQQVIYSSIISQYTTLASQNVAPFGGAYFGNSAPDGYGLGGQLGGAAKFIGDIYNLQQAAPAVPNVTPSDYAVDSNRSPVSNYAYPIFQENNPFVSMTGALKSSVQAMQLSVSSLFLDPPAHNNPAGGALATTWKEDYFAMYDKGVGRVVINPTATQPAWGVVSSVQNPAEIPNTPDENGSKPEGSLSRWQKGMLWSGFGVSDQWTDQHYFYGYYLNSAALAGIFDQSWESNPVKPANLWAGQNQMGTAIDQLVMTLAYDPDNAALKNAMYMNENFTYQKFAFFDQWSGHSWATGASPGTTVAVLNHAADPFGFWRSFGTDSDKYNGENENSIYEGIQAWSSTILWGGATDRKPLVDMGIYLYSTSLAAADSYFLDKNYNLSNSTLNKYSWVPVTTIASADVPKNGENDAWAANTGYNEAVSSSFYTAPAGFGDASGSAAAAGQSLVKKVENTLNNFFYAYPTGSKFIQAYPPTAWTLGIARDTNFMRKWAGAMMTRDWKDARESALYQPADWNAMALTAALSDVPFNPGDVPFRDDGTRNAQVKPYLDRLWSSWVTTTQRPGSHASLNPPYLATSVLTYLLALEEYGTPDWTYIAMVTDSKGQLVNTTLYSAVMTKKEHLSPVAPSTIATTFVAFNPGWESRYVRFHRIKTDGTIDTKAVLGPLEVKPKRMVKTTQAIPVK